MNCDSFIEETYKNSPHDVLLSELKNNFETLEFLTDKVNRQGAFIASICDELYSHGDSNNNFENSLYNKFVDFMKNELEVMKSRVKKIEKKLN